MDLRTAVPLLALVAAPLAAACEEFDPAPEVTIVGANQGTFPTSAADEAVVLEFSERVLPETIDVKLIKYERNVDYDFEQRLLDEQDPKKPLNVVIAYDGSLDEAVNGAASLEGRRRLSLKPDEPFTVGVPYLALVEPGLEDEAGHDARVRQKMEFRFGLTCPSDAPTILPSGPYFFIADVDPPPVAVQLQLFTWFEVDESTGNLWAQFTDGDRGADLDGRAGCPAACGAQEYCRLLRGSDDGELIHVSECASNDDKISHLGEWRDLVPVPDAPDGYTFLARACAADQDDGSIAFATNVFEIDLVIGGTVRVQTNDTRMIGSFQPVGEGFQGSGTISVGSVTLTTKGNPPGTSPETGGVMTMTTMTSDEFEQANAVSPIPRPSPPAERQARR